MNHQAIIGYRYMIVRWNDLDDHDFARMKLAMPVECYKNWGKAYDAAYNCAYHHYNATRLGGTEFKTCAGDDAIALPEEKKRVMKQQVDEGAHDVGFYIGKYGRAEYSVYISVIYQAED
jgi:hypothetical protein